MREMVDSGVEWIGEIPKDWRVSRVGSHADILAGYPFDSTKFGLNGHPLIRIRDLQPGPLETFFDGEAEKKAWVNNGEILVGMDGDFTVCVWSKGPALLNQRLAKISPKTINHAFLRYTVQESVNAINLETNSTTVKHLSMGGISKAAIPLPPLHEQKAIAAFLDRETDLIDRRIDLIERKREYLRELRKSVIHEAVTKGLDKEAEMVDSGVEWIGEIPRGWRILRIGDVADSNKNSFVDGDWIESPFIESSGVRLIQTGNIGVGKYKEQGFRYISNETFEKLSCTEVFFGDILICRLAAPVGRACVAPKLNERMITSVDVCILRPNKRIALSGFLIYLFSSPSYLEHMENLCRGSTRDRVSRSQLGQQLVLLPPLPEQKSIADYLDTETGRIDRMLAMLDSQEALLREQRKTLIHEVVTGKKNVNGG